MICYIFPPSPIDVGGADPLVPASQATPCVSAAVASGIAPDVGGGGAALRMWSTWRFSWRPPTPTTYVTGPHCPRILPLVHFLSFLLNDITHTSSSGARLLALTRMLKLASCLAWEWRTVTGTDGWTKAKVVRRFLPSSSSAGGTPVVLCGVLLYWRRKAFSLLDRGRSLAVILSLKVRMNLSASPLDLG